MSAGICIDILLNFYNSDVIQRIVRLRHNNVSDYGDIRLLQPAFRGGYRNRNPVS